MLVVFFMPACFIGKDNVERDSYRGIIQRIYEDKYNHYITTFSIKSANRLDIKEFAEWFPCSWEYASVGDSIIKEKGELFIRIKKKNGDSKIFYFDP